MFGTNVTHHRSRVIFREVGMADLPVVFIGSSSEGKEVANAVQLILDKDKVCEPIVWDVVFAPGSVTLEALVSQISKFDFAILIFTPDDLIKSRGTRAQVPRDNVLIELGLFIGRLTASYLCGFRRC